jgi:hypothetical protein
LRCSGDLMVLRKPKLNITVSAKRIHSLGRFRTGFLVHGLLCKKTNLTTEQHG